MVEHEPVAERDTRGERRSVSLGEFNEARERGREPAPLPERVDARRAGHQLGGVPWVGSVGELDVEPAHRQAGMNR